MRVVNPGEAEAIIAFARQAGDYFLLHPESWTYTADEIRPGVLFGVRWGCDPRAAHAVLVLKLDPIEEPVIYGDLDCDRTARLSAKAKTEVGDAGH